MLAKIQWGREDPKTESHIEFVSGK